MTDMLKGYYSFFAHQAWTPSVNLYELPTAYLVCVDLAGVEKQKIDIEVIEQRLILKGTRYVPTAVPQEMVKGKAAEVEIEACAAESGPRPRLHLMEIDHGPFVREVELPQNVQRDLIHARYIDGMLWIELPKSQ
jgi:HSP20 family protein